MPSDPKTKKDLLLMLEDRVVLEFNISKVQFSVVDEKHLPWLLKGRMTSTYNSMNAIMLWLSTRSLALSRSNAKIVYQMLTISQSGTDEDRAKMALAFRAVSILDNYWVNEAGNDLTWSQANIRHNKLNKVIPQAVLHGKCASMQGSLCTPEIGTNGTYAKAWRRYPDGRLWLHKAESNIEAMCSDLLDKMDVDHCHYELALDEDKLVSACPAMSSDELSIVDYFSIDRYCRNNGIDPITFAYHIDSEAIHKMCIVDYLIANPDRHDQNWGFYYKPDEMQLIKCHPLFDNNKAFSVMDRNFPYYVTGASMRESAKNAIYKVDFKIKEPIARKDFYTEEQYNEFMWRTNDLGIEV